MTRRALVLRPEPGNAGTCARLRAAGVEPVALPLFAIVPCGWSPLHPGAYDALLLTSANAVRHAGAGLATLSHLPVVAVGEATAKAARDAGLAVALTGTGDAAQVVSEATGYRRLLHLAGRDRVALPGVDAITVYASEALPIDDAALADAAADSIVLLHSARAARRVATANVPRARIAIAALSPAVRAAAGEGWRAVAVADRPTDAQLVACVAALAIDRPRRDADKHGA